MSGPIEFFFLILLMGCQFLELFTFKREDAALTLKLNVESVTPTLSPKTSSPRNLATALRILTVTPKITPSTSVPIPPSKEISMTTRGSTSASSTTSFPFPVNMSTKGADEYDFEMYDSYILPPCYDHEGKIRGANLGSCCSKCNTSQNISCYRNNRTLNICIPVKPINTFQSNVQFLSYVNKIINRYFEGLLLACQITALLQYNISFRKVSFRNGNYGNRYYFLYNENLTEICKPIFDTFIGCNSNDIMITCGNGTKNNHYIFFPSGCKLPAKNREIFESLLVYMIRNQDFSIIKYFCRYSQKILFKDIEGISVILIPPFGGHLAYRLFNSTLNTYWPCCYNYYQVIWMRDPRTVNLSYHWSYLPWECRTGEITLISYQCIMGYLGIFGNLIVISVMFNGGHRGEPSCFLRISLSVADFMINAFVMLPAVFDAIRIIKGVIIESWGIRHSDLVNIKSVKSQLPISSSEIYNVTINSHSTSYFNMAVGTFNSSIYHEVNLVSSFYTFFNYSNGWLQVLRAHILCSCSCVTMIIMFYLSLERLVICWRPFMYKRLFLMYRVKLGIFIAWSFGVISAVLISYGNSFTVYYNSWTKFPLGFRDTDYENNEPLQVISFILCVIGILTVIISVLALIAFRYEQKKVAKERETMNMRITDDFKKENLYITVSLVLMTVFYLIAYVPIGAHILSEYYRGEGTNSPLFLYFSWGLLLGGSSVNPFLYNFRSHLFRSDLSELIETILPESQKSKMKPYITHPRDPAQRYLKRLDQEAAETGEVHDGLPKHSKLRALGFGFDHSSNNTKDKELNICDSAL